MGTQGRGEGHGLKEDRSLRVSSGPAVPQMGEQEAPDSETVMILPPCCSLVVWFLLRAPGAGAGWAGPFHSPMTCGRAWSRDICN